LVLEVSGGSEIDDLDVAKALGVLQQDVLGLEVPVDDAVLVAVKHRRKDLLHYERCHVLLETALGTLDFFEEVSSPNVLLDDVPSLLILEELIDFDYVRMVLSFLNCKLILQVA